jgi:hypothetical protein
MELAGAATFVVDRWAATPEAEKAEAFRVAEAARRPEIALNSYFRLAFGITLLLFGVAVAVGRVFPRWVDSFALVGGVALLVQAVMVGRIGFALQVRGVSAVAAATYSLWFIVMGVLMWRRGT